MNHSAMPLRDIRRGPVSGRARAVPVLVPILALLLLAGCRRDPPAVLPADALYIDVRTSAEFASGRVPGAVNVPLDRIAEAPALIGAKDRAVVVYCRSGRRSGIAKERLGALGYTHVTNGGAVVELARRLGKPLEKP